VIFRSYVGRTVVLAAMTLGAPAVAEQPNFPFLQEGGARSAFVGGSYRTCLEKQRTAPENATLSTPELGAFCLCYGRALADVISGADYEAVAAGKLSDGFTEKQRLAGNVCISRMSTSQQPSREGRLNVAIENRCRREFHPQDTDYAAAQVRERFCGCYAGAVAGFGTDAKTPRDAMDYCSQRL
jgi:hypothetical protein